MNIEEYFNFIVENIHTVVMATVDDEGLPVTCVIDIMDYDNSGLYFLTAKGKGFYDRLVKKGFVAFSAVKGEDTMSSVAISVRGSVKEVGFDMVKNLVNKNPYMNEIYPTKESMNALTVFRLYNGVGEWFDLSKKPIERYSFEFGGNKKTDYSYCIGENCNGCGKCINVCPQGCIDATNIPFVIINKNCLHCGNCANVCSESAVRRL